MKKHSLPSFKQKRSLPNLVNDSQNKSTSLIPLESAHDFLEIFTIRSKQCFFLRIPKILLIDEHENLKFVIENSFLNKKSLVVHSNPVESTKTFFRALKEKKTGPCLKPRKKLRFVERINKALKRFTYFHPVAMVKPLNGDKFPVCASEVEEILRSRGESLSFIQEYIHLPQRGAQNSYETFYCEYCSGMTTYKKKSHKYSDTFLNVCSKHYVPISCRDNKIHTVADRFNYNNNLSGFLFYVAIYQAILDYDYDIQKTYIKNFRKHSISGVTAMNVYNCFDQALNNRMNQACRSLVSFITTKNIEVNKIIVKFLFNSSEQSLFFIGVKELVILPKSGTLSNLQFKIDFLLVLASFPGLLDLKELTIQELQNIETTENEQKLAKNPTLNVSKSKTNINVPSNPYSRKLASILKKTVCGGDFCNHVFGNYEKGGLEELQTIKGWSKELESTIKDDFSQNFYEISSNMINRARELSAKLPELMRKYKITCKSEADLSIKPLILHRNEYKLVKVCRNCYLFYSIFTKNIDFNKNHSSDSQNPYIHQDILAKTSTKRRIFESSFNENPSKIMEKTVFRNIKNTSLGLGLSSQAFSLQKRFFYPSNSKRSAYKNEKNAYINKTINLYKNTVLTRKGEISFNSAFLERSGPDLPTSMLKSPTRESIFGNPKRRSFLFAPEIVKYNFSSGNNMTSPKAIGSPIKRSFTSSFEAAFSLSSPQNVKENKEKPKARNSTFVNKKLANLPTYKIHKILNRRKFFPLSGNASLTHSIFHRNMSNLRKLPHFKINTPKLSLLDGKKGLEEPEHFRINIKGVAHILNIECPSSEIEMLVIDSSTAIPYTVLCSPKSKEVKNKEVLVICNDFFDNFLESIDFYKEMIQDLENYLVILFNYPCQPYSLFNTDTLYNNEALSQCLDQLIYELARRKVFHLRSDNLRFIGFGYGCNVILYFLSSANGAIHTLKACLLFNCFLYLDEQLMDFLQKSINFLTETSGEYSDFLFEAFANKNLSLLIKKNIEKVIQKPNNLFTNEAKIALLKGCLALNDISQNIQKIEKTKMIFANSSHNSLVTYNQKSSLENFPELSCINEFIKAPKILRFAVQIRNSGYNAFKDKPEKVKQLISEFLSTEITLNIDQRISFIDKLLLIIEENMRSFYQEEIENFNSNMEISEGFHSFDLEKFLEVEVDFTDLINGFMTTKEKIDNLAEKIEKVSIVFGENHSEIKEQGDDLISKIVNIQNKKITEFSRYLQVIKKEIEFPLGKELSLLKGIFNFLKISEETRNFKSANLGDLLINLGEIERILDMNERNSKDCQEIEDVLIRDLRLYANLKRKVVKKEQKYVLQQEEYEQSDENNKDLQSFIQKTKKEIIELSDLVEERLSRFLDKIEKTFEEDYKSQNAGINLLKVFSAILQNSQNSVEIVKTGKLDLFGKKNEFCSKKENISESEKNEKTEKTKGQELLDRMEKLIKKADMEQKNKISMFQASDSRKSIFKKKTSSEKS